MGPSYRDSFFIGLRPGKRLMVPIIGVWINSVMMRAFFKREPYDFCNSQKSITKISLISGMLRAGTDINPSLTGPQ